MTFHITIGANCIRQPAHQCGKDGAFDARNCNVKGLSESFPMLNTTNATIVDAVQYLMIVSRVSETFSGMITGIAQRRKRKEPLKASSEFLAKRGFIRCPKKFCTLYRTISDPTPFNRTISCCHMQRASVHQDLCVWILGIHIS